MRFPAILATLLSLPALAAGPLKLETYVGSPAGFSVVSTLVEGEREAVLIDAQFTLSDAHRLVAKLLESGKELKTVYVTHAHPDHYWGLGVIREAFPRAKFVARPEVVAEIRATLPAKLKQWGPVYGANVPAHPLVPDALDGDSLQLEGQVLEVHGGLQGDCGDNSYVWIPSIRTLVAGDLVYNHAHVWLLDAPQAASRKAWLESLSRLEALRPEVVVGGHKDPAAPDSPAAIQFTRAYLQTFDEVLAGKPTPEVLKAELLKRYPEPLALGVLVDLTAQAYGRKP